MTTMIQIRCVPPEFHRRLKARAAMEGVSMSEYILREVGKSLQKPARAEVLARIRAQPTLDLQMSWRPCRPNALTGKRSLVVLDASALIELVLSTAAGKKLTERLVAPTQSLHVPHVAAPTY